MELKDVRAIRVPTKDRNRIGRGPGSGWGVTAGRGYKGQGKRTGTKRRLRFEGGQMPLYRRLPKKGFANAEFKLAYHVVNVGQLDTAFATGTTVDLDVLKSAGLAPKKARYLKLLGFGATKKALVVRCHGVSGGARGKVEAAQGRVELLGVRADHRAKGVKRAVAAPVSAKPGTPGAGGRA